MPFATRARTDPPDLVAVLLRWTFARAFLHRGWWLVTSIYFILDAGLGPAQLVGITIGQGAVALLFEIPAGVIADTVSRRWSLVISHALMGAAMLTTGMVTDFARSWLLRWSGDCPGRSPAARTSPGSRTSWLNPNACRSCWFSSAASSCSGQRRASSCWAPSLRSSHGTRR